MLAPGNALGIRLANPHQAPTGNAEADYLPDFSGVSSFIRVGNAPRFCHRDLRGPLGTRINDDRGPLRRCPNRAALNRLTLPLEPPLRGVGYPSSFVSGDSFTSIQRRCEYDCQEFRFGPSRE